MKAITLKQSTGESFTEFLLYINKLFRKAIEKNHIHLKKSVRESIIISMQRPRSLMISTTISVCAHTHIQTLISTETILRNQVHAGLTITGMTEIKFCVSASD